MNRETTLLPDAQRVRSELSFGKHWDSRAVSELIRRKSSFLETPACLFLGRQEAVLLRSHLAAAFGEDAVATLKGTYYMGLEVVELRIESFVFVGGSKRARVLQEPVARRPVSDRQTEALWRYRIR